LVSANKLANIYTSALLMKMASLLPRFKKKHDMHAFLWRASDFVFKFLRFCSNSTRSVGGGIGTG
jgi:hypothetical protein